MKWVELWAAMAHEPTPEDTPENNRWARNRLIGVLVGFLVFCCLVVIL